jgi:AcrR family transcriptional regulator
MHNGRRGSDRLRSRDLQRTKSKILAAALTEFVAHGFHGARTKAIARRAGVHEWMVFYCFESKRNLYREVLRGQLALRTRLLAELPDDFPAVIETVFRTFARNREVVRLFQWEALTARRGELIAAEERRTAFRQGAAWLQGLQSKGVLPANLDLGLFRLAVGALGSFPFAFPQLTELATGMKPTDVRFQQRWIGLLRWFVQQVLSEPPTNTSDLVDRKQAQPARTVEDRREVSR